MDPALATLLLLAAIIVVVVMATRLYRLQAEMAAKVQEQYERFRNGELQVLRSQYEQAAQRDSVQAQEMAQREATVKLQEWIAAKEEEIRKDAISRSRSVTVGKVSEQLVPFLPGFGYNPKDARFLGSPVDFLVFDGLDEGDLRGLVFVEVKTGNATLNTRERQIRKAVDQRQVSFKVLSLPAVTGNGVSDEAKETLQQ
jgi:predicted Holliday junction resolvase-like endonuclease